jgi:ribonuclease HI
MSIEIYTDGSSLGNPGPSGWGAIILEEDDIEISEIILCGNEKKSTNNRMELNAVIESIDFVNEKEIKIYTDSKYVINCAKGIWKIKKNIDLWNIYKKVSKNKKIEYVWVKGHNGNKYNEMVDKIAKEEANKIK